MYCCDGVDESMRNQSDANSNLMHFPVIQWQEFYDDLQNKTSGYSFLNEPKNHWLSTGKYLLFRWIKSSNLLIQKWLISETDTLNQQAIETFGSQMEKFRELLLVLIHFTAGQPARGTEITNITFENGVTERNIIVERGMVCIRTVYHKGMMQTNYGKIIYRYLPLPVDELLVYYLWLILPFWQTVKGYDISAIWRSKHLFSKDIICQQNKAATIKDLWTTDKLSTILKKTTLLSFGHALNTQMWRQMAIAFARKFLKPFSYGILMSHSDNNDSNDEILDLQAAHSTLTANQTYGLENT
jgi:hypothetical protein